jgi:hypothetical protein
MSFLGVPFCGDAMPPFHFERSRDTGNCPMTVVAANLIPGNPLVRSFVGAIP